MKYPEQVTIQTAAGVFHLKITENTNRDTTESYFIGLGSKSNKCVQLTVPSRESSLKNGKLVWVKAEEDCSFEKYIEKGLARHMVLLGLTLARDINPDLEKIYLDDMSTFKCDLPDNKSEKVQMKQFHIAFHGATWYEYYFDAKLENEDDRKLYNRLKENLYNPDKKPPNFDFNNSELQEELEQLYQSSHTWSEFFKLIDKKYGKKKCGVVYPWLYRSIAIIFDKRHINDNYYWVIDLKENVAKNKTPLIPFRSYEYTNGSRRRVKAVTRKNDKYIPPPHYYMIDIPEVNGMNYKKFIHGR
jgi:hypothetical protein